MNVEFDRLHRYRAGSVAPLGKSRANARASFRHLSLAHRRAAYVFENGTVRVARETKQFPDSFPSAKTNRVCGA